jgi:hypothetical protein
MFCHESKRTTHLLEESTPKSRLLRLIEPGSRS